jgi:hypothetical protein
MRWIIVTAAALCVTACASTPAPEPEQQGPADWYLYVPPAPHAEMAPEFSRVSWVKQAAYHNPSECLTARSALHLTAMQSNQDLAMRALEGVCFNPDEARLVR